MAKWLFIVFSTLLIFQRVYSLCEESPVVTIPDGILQGAAYTTSNNVTYYGFRGIPYAKPPVGELRLEPPQTVEPWEGTWNATVDGHSCVSAGSSQEVIDENEDCLYINVYVPALQNDSKLAVLVWIYGGAFREGTSRKDQYGPDYLIEEGVVVVSLNYRVGPLGFLSAGDSIFPGNYGLKDQTLALKWVQNNIEYFGGDPEKVTIFGQSAGGQSVGYHLVSPLSAGLFRSAIMQSGSGLMHFIERYPNDTVYSIASRISGFESGMNSSQLKAFFQSSSVEDIVAATVALPDGVQCWPVLEPEGEEAFMIESPYDLLQSGEFNQVPVIAGTAAEEALLFLNDLNNTMVYAAIADSADNRIFPYDLFPNQTEETSAAENIRGIYLSEGETFSSNLLAFAHYFSDRNFTTGILEHAELASNFVPVYLYQYAYSGGRAVFQPFLDGAEGATHSSELPFLFSSSSDDSLSDEESDLLNQKRLTKLWTNFAKYLNPTPEELDLFGNLTWPLLDSENHPYLNINASLEIGENFRQERLTKWVDIYETYGIKPIITV